MPPLPERVMRPSFLKLVRADPVFRLRRPGDQLFREVFDSFSSLESALLAAEASHAVLGKDLAELAVAVGEWAACGRGAGKSPADTVSAIEAMILKSGADCGETEGAARAAFVAGWCARPNSGVAAVRDEGEELRADDSASGSPDR